jgi:FkbM family methyltransferase
LNDIRIQRINAQRYEGQEIAGALALAREGDNILELGAGLGLVGAVLAKNRAPGRMISFEANPNLVPHIQALYRLNGLDDRIELRNQVLVSHSERPKTLPFHVHNSYLGSSLSGDAERARETVQVPTADFEALRRELHPDVIVMDIEGGELDILEHADLAGVRAIVIEFHPKAYEVAGMRQCKSILRRAGFAPVKDLSTRLVWAAEREV